MKVKVRDEHCKGCVWLTRENLCPFHRCVKRYGFKVQEAKKDEQKTDRKSNL